MRLLLVGLMALGSLAIATGSIAAAKASANPPTAEQKAEFYKVCVKNSPQAAELCNCKANAAMTLIDAKFMTVVIASMSGDPLEPEYFDAYSSYIANSTGACGMGM